MQPDRVYGIREQFAVYPRANYWCWQGNLDKGFRLGRDLAVRKPLGEFAPHGFWWA
jgi:hypothetical protein